MPQITLVVNLSEQKADQLSKIAQNLNCTTDDFLQSIIDRYFRDQDIMDRSMSVREIHHVVAHSPNLPAHGQKRTTQLRKRTRKGHQCLV